MNPCQNVSLLLRKTVKTLILIGAVLSGLLGLAFGIMAVMIAYSVLFGDLELSMLGFIVPLICFSAIPLIVAIRYIKDPKFETARGVAGMAGVAVWAITNPMAPDFQLLEPRLQHYATAIAPIIFGIIVYRLLLIPIRKAFRQPTPKSAKPSD